MNSILMDMTIKKKDGKTTIGTMAHPYLGQSDTEGTFSESYPLSLQTYIWKIYRVVVIIDD